MHRPEVVQVGIEREREAVVRLRSLARHLGRGLAVATARNQVGNRQFVESFKRAAERVGEDLRLIRWGASQRDRTVIELAEAVVDIGPQRVLVDERERWTAGVSLALP